MSKAVSTLYFLIFLVCEPHGLIMLLVCLMGALVWMR